MRPSIGPSRTETVGELRLEHGYFRKTRFMSRVRVVPDARSLRLGIEVRDVGDAFRVVRREPLLSGAGRIRVAVGIVVSDPEFCSYSQWDDASIESGEPAIRYLNPSVSGGPEFVPRTCPALPLRPRRFNYRLSRPAGGLQGRTEGPIGVPAQVVAGSLVDPRSSEYPVDVRSVESGGCEAGFRFTDGTAETFRFYANDCFRRENPGIVMEWDWDAAAGEPLRASVRFEARATVWRYYLLGIPPGGEAGFRIRSVVDNGAAIRFVPARPVPPSDGLPPALVLQSEVAIPLSESPGFKVLLESDTEWGGRVLPFPATHTSRLIGDDGNSVACSDIFVTV